MNNEVKKALTEGLLAGYAGKTEFGDIRRGAFDMKQSHYENDGISYHDEWLPNRTGGGQELIKIDGQQFTRVYAGGLVAEETLKHLNISEQDVITTLINQIKLLCDKTRLDQNCKSVDGDWEYIYEIQEDIREIGLIVAEEKIFYRAELVFVHYFLLTPIV